LSFGRTSSEHLPHYSASITVCALLPHDHAIDAGEILGLTDWLGSRHPEWRKGKRSKRE
jgi:hypothetical protein